MKIQKGSEVTFHYELRDETGKVIDSTFGGDPVHYIHGKAEIILGLENFFENEEPGFTAKLTIDPENAYGVKREDLIVFAGPENFEDNVEVEIGSIVETEDPDGNIVEFRITKIEEDKVYLDGNHPLADKTLDYKIEIIEVA
jgi:FKBP-type peptidyl-prolyl cis-trans isomerase SlyD